MAMDAPQPAERVHFDFDELLADGHVAEPLIANGVRCHGGFTADGAYQSPRTLHRAPAIAAWQAQLSAAGAPLIQVSSELMPPQYPSVEQAVLLCENGVRDPIVRALTIISVVEGFGAIIRDVEVPDFSACIVEPIEAPRSPTSARASSRRTRATRPVTGRRAATSRCGRRRATSRSRIRASRPTS